MPISPATFNFTNVSAQLVDTVTVPLDVAVIWEVEVISFDDPLVKDTYAVLGIHNGSTARKTLWYTGLLDYVVNSSVFGSRITSLTTNVSLVNSDLSLSISALIPLNITVNRVALENGTIGSLIEGGGGIAGKSAYDLAVLNGYLGTEVEWLASLVGTTGSNGMSAYDVAVMGGFSGTSTEWFLSLKGEQGIAGIQGEQGLQGIKGDTGLDGSLYTLPIASTTTLGGVKQGTNITITPDGTISATGGASGGTALIFNTAGTSSNLMTSEGISVYSTNGTLSKLGI